MGENEILKLAFNQGYELQKSDPELASSIASSFSDPSIPYANGFIGGVVEHIKEIGQSPELFLQRIKAKGTTERELER